MFPAIFARSFLPSFFPPLVSSLRYVACASHISDLIANSYFQRGCGADLLINILLTILGYIPGIIHALLVSPISLSHHITSASGCSDSEVVAKHESQSISLPHNSLADTTSYPFKRSTANQSQDISFWNIERWLHEFNDISFFVFSNIRQRSSSLCHFLILPIRTRRFAQHHTNNVILGGFHPCPDLHIDHHDSLQRIDACGLFMRETRFS